MTLVDTVDTPDGRFAIYAGVGRVRLRREELVEPPSRWRARSSDDLDPHTAELLASALRRASELAGLKGAGR